MQKFNKLVAVEYIPFPEEAWQELHRFADQVTAYDDHGADAEELIRRIGDAEAALVFYRTRIPRQVLAACPQLKYVGMCCSLYHPDSANVDIAAARELGIEVKAVADYADEGTAEFIVSELLRLMHGLGDYQWREMPAELTGLKVGVIGLGAVGSMLARYLQFMKADLYYYDRSRKPDLEREGVKYLPLEQLLATADVLSTHLPKGTRVLRAEEFALFGDGKIYINCSNGPVADVAALRAWLDKGNNYYICDLTGWGAGSEPLQGAKGLLFTNIISGTSSESIKRLSKKAQANLAAFLKG